MHFQPLTFTTICNLCTYPIPPSHTRYHCQKCNKGDYDVCMNCYHKLIVSGRISRDEGINGWRRCLRGHRMIVVGFEDRDAGQRRRVVRDLVGGLALRDGDAESANISPSAKWSDTSTKSKYRQPQSPSPFPFPPDGGVGLRIQALWSYFPSDGVTDELAFPKNAEIREAEDINGDWFWGVYAGVKGLFPGNYGRVVGGSDERAGRI